MVQKLKRVYLPATTSLAITELLSARSCGSRSCTLQLLAFVTIQLIVLFSLRFRYKNASRSIWKLRETDVDVAGYVRVYKNLVQVGVRNAGHILPYDQPERAWSMIDNFISAFQP